MSTPDVRNVPADHRSRDALAASGLTYRVIDVGDDADAHGFLQAEARGFLDREMSAEVLADHRETIELRRNVGVFADGIHWPVATVNAWDSPLTVPGGELPLWAISAVTVSATHRRRGIARNLLEGELRSAAGAGFAVAGLTVSEATIYGRYGFAPAVWAARFRVDARRAGWVGPVPEGRVEYIGREALAIELGDVHERARRVRAGQLDGWPGRWRRAAGLAPDDKDGASVRGACYRDAAGVTRGAMAYRLVERTDGFASDLEIRHLAAETPDAHAALWRFALQHDLVATVTADQAPADDSLPWLVADARAIEQIVHDHGWLRILDVPAALAARTYEAGADLTLRVDDPLGYASGQWRARIEDGRAEISESTAATADVTLDVGALSAAYLGGVSLSTLRDAGRVSGIDAAVLAADAALRTPRAPQLSFWY